MALGTTKSRIYVAGECCVCGGAGAAVFMKSVCDGRIFFACPACGCAWADPPRPHYVETADPPEKFAPAGFTFARSEDIRSAELEGLIKGDVDASDWDFSDAPSFAART
jgi:hypothetical protein